jgi:hypothetical protein
MSDYLEKIQIAFELHSVEQIKDCFAQGVDPNANYRGKPLVYSLINMYSRGPRFRECIRTFADCGMLFEDEVLLAVLLNDPVRLEQALAANPGSVEKRYSFDCAFTPLYDVTLLHICAEYNHRAAAEVLVKHGADIHARAGVDEHGFGGQTPVFHTVNQHDNTCMDMLEFLLAKQADLSYTVMGLIWGKGYDWETFIPSVNPVSYAIMGLLRQFQRREDQIYEVISLLMQARYGVAYRPPNIPNKYLNS